jgi:hypothetical protein
VGKHGSGKTQLLRSFAAEDDAIPIDLGSEMPPSVFDLPSRQRCVAAADRFGDLVRAVDDTAIIDGIEVLFHPDLMLDPLKLFQDNSRNRVLIVAWPGTFGRNELTFAAPGHPEFRSYTSPDAIVLGLQSSHES